MTPGSCHHNVNFRNPSSLQNSNHMGSVPQFVKLPSCLPEKKISQSKIRFHLRLLGPKNLAPANSAVTSSIGSSSWKWLGFCAWLAKLTSGIRGKFNFFFKERNFHFLRWLFHPGKDILYIPKGGDAGSPNNEKISKQMPGITSKESKVKQTTLFSSLY